MCTYSHATIETTSFSFSLLLHFAFFFSFAFILSPTKAPPNIVIEYMYYIHIHLNAILNCMPAPLCELKRQASKRNESNEIIIIKKLWNLSTAAVAATGCRLLLLFRWFEMRLSGCMSVCAIAVMHAVWVRACISNTHHRIRICSSATEYTYIQC